MFKVEVDVFNTRKEISSIYSGFAKYKSIKYIKQYTFRESRMYAERQSSYYGSYSYVYEDHFIVYYDEDEYIAECLLYGNNEFNLFTIDGIRVKYEAIEKKNTN